MHACPPCGPVSPEGWPAALVVVFGLLCFIAGVGLAALLRAFDASPTPTGVRAARVSRTSPRAGPGAASLAIAGDAWNPELSVSRAGIRV